MDIKTALFNKLFSNLNQDPKDDSEINYGMQFDCNPENREEVIFDWANHCIEQ